MSAEGSVGELSEKDFDVMVDMGYGRMVSTRNISASVEFSGAEVKLGKSGQEKFARAALRDNETLLSGKHGKWDVLSEKSFNFQKPTKTANFRAARITDLYFTIVDPTTGTTYESSFALEIGVPIKINTGRIFSQKTAIDKSAMVLNAVATQIATLEDLL